LLLSSGMCNSGWQEASLRCLFFVSGLLAFPVGAQPVVEELIALDFGTLAITGNDSVSTLELPRSGRNLAVSGDLVIVEVGAPGRYLLTGFPPGTNVDIDLSETTLTAGGTGVPEPLAVDRFNAGSTFTNEQGEAEVQLGASFSTSGNGGVYEDAPYSGDSAMRLTYWEPDVGNHVTVSKNVTFTGEVRSSLELEELQGLHFGILFARATPDNQATMRLFPDGRVNIANAGDARMVSLSEAAPGVLLVGGGAPNRDLTIDIQAGDVLLRHVQQPAGPHFVLSDLETSPASSGSTNETGRLEIRVGGTLSTQLIKTGTSVYPAGTYEGTYSVTVSY